MTAVVSPTMQTARAPLTGRVRVPSPGGFDEEATETYTTRTRRGCDLAVPLIPAPMTPAEWTAWYLDRYGR